MAWVTFIWLMMADGKRPRFDCLLLDRKLATASGLEFQRQLAALGGSSIDHFHHGKRRPANA
jgi:hypothetical protein